MKGGLGALPTGLGAQFRVTSRPNGPCPKSNEFPLVDLCNYFILNPHVHKPTGKSNIIDLIVCPNDLSNTISISDTFSVLMN